MQRIKKPRINTPEYTAYVNKLMIDLYVKSLENKEKEKIYEDVPYSERNIAKQYGGKWDATKNSWYFTNKSDWEDFINH
jgi:hypothetical protein